MSAMSGSCGAILISTRDATGHLQTDTFVSVGFNDGEEECSPINRKIFMAVRRQWM
jgi:hypothetical protein